MYFALVHVRVWTVVFLLCLDSLLAPSHILMHFALITKWQMIFLQTNFALCVYQRKIMWGRPARCFVFPAVMKKNYLHIILPINIVLQAQIILEFLHVNYVYYVGHIFSSATNSRMFSSFVYIRSQNTCSTINCLKCSYFKQTLLFTFMTQLFHVWLACHVTHNTNTKVILSPTSSTCTTVWEPSLFLKQDLGIWTVFA